MSKYLETLVENMLTDNVSEKDIRKVIEEVTKKSPLNQVEQATILDPGSGYDDIILGAKPTDIKTVKTEDQAVTEKPEVEVKKEEPTCPDCNGEPVKPDENGICPECIQETTEDKIAKEDAAKLPTDRPITTQAGKIEKQKQEREYVNPFANDDLTIKPDFFDLDEDSAITTFKSLYGGLPGVKIEAATMFDGVSITFPNQPESELTLFTGAMNIDSEASADKLNSYLNSYIAQLPGGQEEFDVYAKIISGMHKDFAQMKANLKSVGEDISSENIGMMQNVALMKGINAFKQSKEYTNIQDAVLAEVVDPNNSKQLLKPLADKVAELTKDMSPEEIIEYQSSDEFRNNMLADLEDIIYENIYKHPDFINKVNLYSNAATAVYGQTMEDVGIQEAEVAHLPWFARGDSDFLKGMWKTLGFSFPLAAHSTRMMNVIGYLSELEEFEKGIINRDPNSMVYFRGGTNEDIKLQRGYGKYPELTKIKMPNKYVRDSYRDVTSLAGPSHLGSNPNNIFSRKVTWEEVYGVSRPNNLPAYSYLPLSIEGSHKVSDLLKKIQKIREFYRDEIVMEFATSQEYQQILESLGTVQFFTEEGFNWDIDDWQEACGTQMMQCISAVFTSSISVKAQEQAGVFIEAMYHEAAKIRGIKVGAFKMLPMEEQGKTMLTVIDSGLADNIIYEAEKHGSRAALMESLENAFIISKGVKFIPRELSLQLLKNSAKKFFGGAWKYIGKDLTVTSLVQLGIELGQEFSGDLARRNLDIGPDILTVEFWDQRTKYKEVAFQTIITAPFIFLGMKGASTTWNRVENKILSFKEENLARRAINRQIDQLRKDYKNDNITDEFYTQKMRVLEAALEQIDFIIDPKLSKTDKLRTVNAKVKELEYLEGIEELEAQLKKLEKGTPEHKSIDNKIRYKKRRAKKFRTEQEVIRAKNNLKISLKDRAARINSSAREGEEKKEVLVFKTKDELILYLDSKNNKGRFSTEDIEAILYAEERIENAKIVNGKVVGESAAFEAVSEDGNLLIACEEILDNMVSKMDGSTKDQWVAANAINHGVLHMEMANKSLSELLKMKGVVERTIMEASLVDPQWAQVYLQLEGRLQDYADIAPFIVDPNDSKKEIENPNSNPRTYLEEWFTSLSDVLQDRSTIDFTLDGAAYWTDIAIALEELLKLPSTKITEESALEFIKKFNERGKKNGKPVISSWWLDEYNRPVIQTFWEINDGLYQAVDFLEKKNFQNTKISKQSKATKYSDATEILIRESEKQYGPANRTTTVKSEESARIQDELIKAASYIFDNKDGQYTDERALQIQNDVRDGQKKRYENLLVLNNITGVLKIIDRYFDEGKAVSRFDFESAVFAEFASIIKDYKPLLTEKEWNEFIANRKEKDPNFVPPSKITNKDVDGEAKITNPVNFFAYALAENPPGVLRKRIAGIWDELVFNQFQQYTEDVTEATNLEGDYDVDTVLDLQHLVDEYEELSELKKILKIENTDPVYVKINNEVYRLMGEVIQNIDDETFTQDFRNESRELFWKDLKNIVGTPKKFKTWLRKTDKEGTTNAQKLYEVMPQAVMNTSYTEFTDLIEERMNTEQSEKSLEVLVKNKYAGNDLRRKKEYTSKIEEQWIARIAPEVRPDMAQEGILKHLSDEIARDAVMQTIQSQKFKDEFGITTSEIMQVSMLLQRGIAVKFSTATGAERVIHQNKISGKEYYNQSMLLIEDLEEFAPDNLEEAEVIVNQIKGIYPEVKDFILSLWNKELIANGQSIRYGINMENYLEKNNPELLESWKKDGSWSSITNPITKKAKDKLFNDIAKIARKRPWLFKILKFDILGKHLRYLDGALKKEVPGWREKTKKEKDALLAKDPEARWLRDENGDFVMGEFGQRFLDLENEIAALNIEAPPHIQAIMNDVGMMVGGETLMGITKEINVALDELRDQNINGQEAANEIERRFGDKVAAVNNANQEIMVEFGKAIAEGTIDGSISEKSVIHLLQIQSSLQKGIRAYTTLELISVLEKGDAGLDTRVGVEHLTDNAQTCFALAKLILDYTADQTIDLDAGLRAIFKDHNLWLTRKKYMDYIDDEGGKNNPNKIRRVLLLSEKDLSKVFSIIGALPAKQAINKKENLETLDDETIQLVKENEEQRELRKIIENIEYGEQKGATVADLDETVIIDSKNVVYATNSKTGEKRIIKSADFVGVAQQLSKEGFEFDFSDYATIKGGKKGPFFSKLKSLYDTYGPDAVHILTARQPEAAVAIQKWLEQNGIKLPLKNIIGLGVEGVVVTGEMKADWIEQNLIHKGFTDILFADDAILNVEAVRKMFAKYPKGLLHKGGKAVLVEAKQSRSTTFNRILEETKGIDRKKQFSKTQAKVRGKNRGRFNIFISPSAEDFQGLLLQMTGKGAKGKAHIKWFNDNLVKPYLEGVDRIDVGKVKLMTDYKALIKKLPGIKKKLKKEILREDGTKSNLTNGHAVRVYLWDLNGITIPGISKRDRELLISRVKSDPELLSFAKGLSAISNQKEGYVQPTEFWSVETIASDMHRISMTLGRQEHLETFIKNKNEIFSEENLNKIEAVYGPDFREALENILWRMENGTNKNNANAGRIEREWDKWVNNSVGAIMFLNMRSAVLQTLSTLNYIDWKYNNPLAAAKAFANQKEFWNTFVEIWNSPMLKERRSGKRMGIHESEIASFNASVIGSSNPAKAAISWLLEKGFIPTQLADNFAIAMGGASFLINARKHHAKTAPTLEEAEKRAWEDFRAKTQEAQQSADPMYISQQQASGLGRIILAFKNTPMQYARLMKKEVIKLVNGTSENPAASVAKIGYYAAVQNFMFTALQTALFAALDEDDPDWEKKEDRVIKGMVDSILYGMGLQGVIVATVKNGIITFMEQEEKGWNADHTYTIIQFANLSPTIGSKLRKLYSSIQTYRFNKETIDYMSLWDPANPAWQAVGNLIEAVTNAPTGQAVEMINNLIAISADENEWWQNLSLLLGWNTWDVDVETKSNKLKGKAKEFINNAAKEAKNIEAYNKEVKEGKEDIKCVAAAKDGRCGNPVLPGEMYCTVHEKVLQRTDDKDVRCKGKRTNGEQCKMMTTSKSGYCVYHD